MSFANLGLSEPLLRALNDKKYTQPYPIQQQAIPAILAGKDVLGIAQTGSGKTAGFALPVLRQFQDWGFKDKRHIKSLVLVPTRELAVQVSMVFQELSAHIPEGITVTPVYGGVAVNPQMIDVHGSDILVATPGRLLELIDKNALSLSAVKILVLDEADKMLNLGFKDEMDRIFSLLPKKRQNLLFSATLSDDLNTINKSLLRNPAVVKVEEEVENIDLIRQFAYKIAEEKKGPLLRYLIRKQGMKQVLVFTSSTHRADAVAQKLSQNGVEAFAIHSKKTQAAREQALDFFKRGKVRALVATDLIARGIDIENLPFVINYELPRSPKDYIHRIGRTGRAGTTGEAISLISPEEEHHFKVIQKKMKKHVTQSDGNALDLKGF